MEFETGHFSLEEIEQAIKVAKRLLGPPKLPAGTYMMIHAEEHISTGDIVFLNSFEKARKCTGNEMPSGIALGTVTKGSYGWIKISNISGNFK